MKSDYSWKGFQIAPLYIIYGCRMDSYALAETFKYLYMIFAEEGDLLFDPDNYVFTTEAHFLPLSIAQTPKQDNVRFLLFKKNFLA